MASAIQTDQYLFAEINHFRAIRPSGILLPEHENLAENVVQDHDDELHQDLRDSVVHVQDRYHEEHREHVDQEGADPGEVKADGLLEDVLVLALEDVDAAGEVRERHRRDPREDVGDLELHRLVRVQKGEDAKIVGAEADDGRHAPDDDVADDLFVFLIVVLQHSSLSPALTDSSTR